MLQILILADGGRGKSTLAAHVAKLLTELKIPIELIDGEREAGDAFQLMNDNPEDVERLRRNTMSISGRESLTGGKVLITTQNLGRPARSRIPPGAAYGTETMRIVHDKPNMEEVPRPVLTTDPAKIMPLSTPKSFIVPPDGFESMPIPKNVPSTSEVPKDPLDGLRSNFLPGLRSKIVSPTAAQDVEAFNNPESTLGDKKTG